ncbi:unnamed protein product [Spirodela intermedia]|uniref:Uncharacterized protein n=1 Tax=Spirodela intermedia TaxID=51605 RepID=A0A7I8K168_SPIIN|nr:unnamed protein product [Spirodela intermedia]
MGMEYIQNCFNEESTSIPSVPPGFASSKSFTLERIDDDTSGSYVAPASVTLQTKINGQQTSAGEEKFSKCLRQRPCINYSQFDNSSDEESDSELPAQGAPSVCCLPKGTVRGCPECSNCQKVTARWRPEEACRPIINDAPIFYPTEEEFEDTLKYIASIRPKAEFYGICLIVPPPSWNPPCPLKEKHAWENCKFSTRVQKIDKLQNRYSARKLTVNNYAMKNKRRRLMKTESGLGKVDAHSMELNGHVERFGFEPGPEFTLKSFESYADEFKEQYFRIKESDNWSERKPSVEVIEGEYWRMVEKPTEEIEVLYGADIETGSFGSGFPKMSSDSTNSSVDDKYVKSGWNLNNFPRLTGSVLAFEDTDISGVLVPWLYVGMCFSSFCWHVEDHHFYSLNYMHWGAPKVWYGVPGGDALKLETAMKKHLPDLFEEQPDLLHNLVTQFSPSILKAEGVPVFRCVQNRGQFVLTFPRAYHSGFNCGFNCAEAVNVAPIDWLPHGQFAVELYRGQRRKISVSHDKLLLGAAREAVRAQWNILFLGKKSPDNLRWKDECGSKHTRRENLCSSSQSRKMDANFDADTERECSICHYDLHLSAVGCSCSSERFACLEHGNEMCACTWNMRIFLFRYEISELNVLLDAVGGKLSAVHRWALSDLGLSLSSYIQKDKMQDSYSKSKKKEGTKPMEQRPLNRESLTSSMKDSCSPQDTQVPMSQTTYGISIVKDAKISDLITSTHTMIDQSVSNSTIQGCNEGIGKDAVDTSEKRVCAADSPSPDTKLQDQPFQATGCHKNSDGFLSGQTSCSLPLTDLPSNELQQYTRERYSIPSSARVHKSNHLSNLNNMDRPSVAGDVIQLSDDEDDEAYELSHKTKAEPVENSPDVFYRPMDCNNKVTPSNCERDQVLETPETDASVMDDTDINLVTIVKKVDNMSNSHVRVKDQGKDEITMLHSSLLTDQSSATEFSQGTISTKNSASKNVANQIQEYLASKQVGDSDNSIVGTMLLPSQFHVSVNASSGKNNRTIDSSFKMAVRGQSGTVSQPVPQIGTDRYNRQGPRMAKVVRRINSVVEPLALGVVLSGQFWSCGQAIFPKGYRSRVRYFSVLDPSQMCYYVSEILDAGLLCPLFMVQVEHCPNEVFIHLSATRCWDMVRDRVNHEIRKQHSLGRTGVPAMQPPGSLDGLEMFGLTSPAIIKAIEANDVDHVCSEYWKSRPRSLDPQVPEGPAADWRPTNMEAGQRATGPGMQQQLVPGADAIFRSLLRKLNPEELQCLGHALGDDGQSSKEEALKLINNEIEGRPKP